MCPRVCVSCTQAAEVVRKDAFFSTVSAQMKAAREQLPSLGVKHAPRPDTTIFTKPPKAEVNMLLPEVQAAKVRPAHTSTRTLTDASRVHTHTRTNTDTHVH